ncbi:MAG: Holliday junction branch migration protein RuvA [Rickettsiales bacterium]|nr:Holliday junction branch migration protein RuvA [Rickettsiales bacterium]
MIGKLKGIVDSCYHDHVVIDVGGVGYLVFCSSRTLANLTPGDSVMLLIETHVREDHIHLYGFYSSEEKSSFILLQSVKGVGTRMSLAILSTLSPDEISYALATKDTTAFSRVSGVGKKLAERIITELKDKYSSNYISEIPITSSAGKDSNINNIAIDSISALVALGINKAEAQNRVNTLLAQDNNISLNELIKLALKN